MKYTSLVTCLILLGMTVLDARPVDAQEMRKTQVALHARRWSMKQLLKELEKQTNFHFVYNDGAVPEKQLISLDQNGNLYDVLMALSENTGTRYEQVGNNIVVTYHPPQNMGIIIGTVTNDKGEPLPGASVRAVEAKKSVGADGNGHFSLSLQPGTYTLEVSYVSHDQQHKAGVEVVGGQTLTLDFKLKESEGLLNEVVVVGYGTQKKVNLTGAVDQVGSEVFEGRIAANTTQMLQGAVPNLNITPADGKPTRNPSFNIRGTTSIGQGGSALVLIDGVEGNPQALNPSDIESVSVLKDAASASIYGSRGTFGVVLITTRKPKAGKTSVTYAGNVSVQQRASSPDFVTDGYEYASHFYEAYNAWNNYSSVPAKLNKTQPFTLDWLDEFKRRKEQGITEEVTTNDLGDYVYYGNEDYYKTLVKDHTLATDQNLTISGNNAKVDYYLSGRYYGYDGLYRYNTDKYKSYNLRAKEGVQLTDWLRIDNNIEYYAQSYHDPVTGGEGGNIWRNIADEGHPSSLIFNPDGSLSYSAAYSVGDFIYGKNGINSQDNNLRNTTSFETKFLNNALHIRGDLTFRSRDFASRRIRVPIPYSTREGETQLLKTSFNDLLYEESKKYRYITGNLYADYEKHLGANHYFKALVGYNYQQQTYQSTYLTKNGLLTENTQNLNLALGDLSTITAGYNKYRIAGAFYRVNYAFKDRYLLELNGRYDGSSKFPTNEQWAFFPSVSAGWRVSQESFWHVNPDAISDLKIRGSYGSLGNGNVDAYSFLSIYDIATSDRILGGNRYRSTKAPDVIPDNLTWETARTANLGLDISALKNKLSFTGDIYQRKTLDMYTVGPTLPDVFGADSPKGNYADMTTKGFEVSVSYQDQFAVAGKPMHMSVRATLADYVSTIDRYNNLTGNIDDYYVGKKVGDIWGYVTQGLFQSQEEIDNAPKQNVIKSSNSGKVYPGDIRFADLDHNGVIDYGTNTLSNHGDKTVIGNENPRYIYSLNLNFDWNNFFIGSFFQGVGKQDWYPSNESIFWGQYNRPYNNLPVWHLNNYWTEDNPNAYLPRYAGYNESLKLNAQTRYLQNVAYIRLKNLQVGYNLPTSLVSRWKMQAVKISLSGENLWTWSPLYKRTKDIDVGNIGKADADVGKDDIGDGFNYPIMKSVSLNLTVNF